MRFAAVVVIACYSCCCSPSSLAMYVCKRAVNVYCTDACVWPFCRAAVLMYAFQFTWSLRKDTVTFTSQFWTFDHLRCPYSARFCKKIFFRFFLYWLKFNQNSLDFFFCRNLVVCLNSTYHNKFSFFYNRFLFGCDFELLPIFF